MDERRLAEKLNRRSRTALEQAVELFTPYVNTVAWRTLGERAGREDLEEIVSDVFLALWENAPSLDPTQGLRPWLGTVARNKALDRLRRPVAVPLEEDTPSPARGPEDVAEGHDEAEKLWRAVEALGEPDTTLFLRHYYYGDKLSDLAEELGLGLGNVKVRLSRGRKRLKELLTKGGDAL